MSLDAFLYRLRRKGALDYLTLTGKSNGAVTVLIRDNENKILMASGTSLPSDGGSTYAKGCVFIKTDAADTARAWYENIGTKTSCNFEQGAFADASLDSKITSLSVIASSNLVTGDSKSASLSSLVHTADSKATSVSVIASANLVTGNSKAASLSVIASTNLSTNNSKDTSQSVILSNHESRLVSHSL